MKRIWSFLSLLCLAALAVVPANAEPIDRHALVTRHNLEWNELAGQIPLGNGEFAFNADATGLQTFGGSTMAHWAWHTAPLPAGYTMADVPPTGTTETGRIQGMTHRDASREDLREWQTHNPQAMNLARLRLLRADGTKLETKDLRIISRRLDLWTGWHTSRFEVDGQPVTVETYVHPKLDLVAVHIESPLLKQKSLVVVLDFPYPSHSRTLPWCGDWNKPDAHTSKLTLPVSEHAAEIHRQADTANYNVRLNWNPGSDFSPWPEGKNSVPTVAQKHSFKLTGNRDGKLEFVCAFFSEKIPGKLPTVAETRQATAGRWQEFWSTGGAIDLSGSKDPRWRELERRIVLSQYHMAAQSAGSWPSAEIGLMGMDNWSSKFHMEMVWWHLAHYALWDRWALADSALGCYQKFLPVAKQLAQQFDYRGAKWGKMVGPEGRTSPWAASYILHWQQPHPIFFAELEYRLRPTQATLEKWQDIVQGTADYLADFPTADANGVRHLQPIMPPSEQGMTSDTVFDLAYWRWALDTAQLWRQRLNLPREKHWDDVRQHLAPLPVMDGLFLHSPKWRDTYTKRAWEHPNPVGVLGMLPPMEGVDRETAHRSVLKVWETWDWKRCWGWDFPWMAMAAARVGEPKIAVDALLKDAGSRNFYDARGVNTGGPCPYLPGNGGLLYAVAMMAAGWDGAPTNHAPGFPQDGSWTVKWEGLKPAP